MDDSSPCVNPGEDTSGPIQYQEARLPEYRRPRWDVNILLVSNDAGSLYVNRDLLLAGTCHASKKGDVSQAEFTSKLAPNGNLLPQ